MKIYIMLIAKPHEYVLSAMHARVDIDTINYATKTKYSD